MPRFPILPQRTSAPAAFSNTPRAQAAHFGAGIGRNLAKLGSEAADLGQVVEQRQERQVKQQMSQFDLDLAKQRAESDVQAPPEEASEARIERHQSIFDASAERLLQGYEGQGLQGRLSEGIEARRETWNQKLLAGAAQQRLGESLRDARGLVEHWAGRIAADAAEFPTASRELLGDETSGEPGLLAGLGLRPEALDAWRGHVLKQLLDAQMQSDPAGLLTDLEVGRWQEALPDERRNQLLEDAEDALARRQSVDEIKRKQTRGGKTLELSQSIKAGTAGLVDIRQAEEAGALSSPQAEALRGEAKRAEIALQAQQVAGDELAISLSSGVGFDADNPQNRQAADDFYEKTFSQAIREGASKEVLAQVVSAVARTGYLPPRLVRDTTGLMHGGDGTRLIAGAELYAGLRGAAPEVVTLAFDPETRARGGVLKRWLDLGLEPADALQRAEAEWPRDGKVQILEDDEMEVLKRDLGSLFTGAQPEHHVDQILAQLERNYLDDLGKGLTPRQARQQLQRDVGRVMRRLTLLRDTAGEEPEQSGGRHSPLLVPVRAKSNPGNGKGGKPDSKWLDWLMGPFHPSDDKLAEAATQELQRGAQSVIDTLIELYDIYNTYVSEVRASNFPGYAAFFFNNAMVSIGDGEKHLSYILDEHERNGTRSLGFEHPEHGAMVVRQRYDISEERFRNLDITFKDPETGEYVTERYPSSRFTVSASDAITQGSPSLTPPVGVDKPLEGYGTQGNVDQSNTTAGDPTDHSAVEEPAPGFVAIGPDGPRITAFPDQSDELKIPIIILSEGGYRNAKKGDLSADGTFTWYHPGRYTTNKTLRKQHAEHHNIVWPLDPDTGNNQDVSHPDALADGGPDYFGVIEPMPRKKHIEHHMENGDFKRWRNQRGK